MRIQTYNTSYKPCWDEFVNRSKNGTLLFWRDYMEYHNDRFVDNSLLVFDDKERLFALLPANKRDNTFVSHGGLTYGGFITNGQMRAATMLEIFDKTLAYLREDGFDKLIYKPVPAIYHRAPAAEDLYALFVNKAVRYRCDLSCAINFAHRLEMSSRRKRSLKKALKCGVRVDEGANFAADLWSVLEGNLLRKYKARPVHSLSEITYLHSLFDEQIKFVVALFEDKVVAGVVLFVNKTVTHVQYVAASETGYEVSALDAVFDHCIEAAANEGKRFFDFGTSNEAEGRTLNSTLYDFKSEFGGGGVAHEFYEIDLR